MKGSAPRSAGILLFRRNPDGLKVLLGHPGGPFWRNRHEEAWSIPKGECQMTLVDVTVPVLRSAFGMRAEVSAAATMARTHSVWSRFYRFCRSEGLTVLSPIDEIEKVKTGTTKPRSIETPDLAMRLLETAAAPPPGKASTRWPVRDAAIVTTLMATGIRLFELVALHRLSITGEPGAYQLDVAGKGAKYRSIPAMDGLVDRITSYQAQLRERFPKHRLDRRTTPLFVHPHTGDRITTRQVQYLLDRIYREAGVRAQVPDVPWSMLSGTPLPWICWTMAPRSSKSRPCSDTNR
jgi:site-specific recombinase XerD